MNVLNQREFASFVAKEQGYLPEDSTDVAVNTVVGKLMTAVTNFANYHSISGSVVQNLYNHNLIIARKQDDDKPLTEYRCGYLFELVNIDIYNACRKLLEAPMLEMYVEKIITSAEKKEGVLTSDERKIVAENLAKRESVKEAMKTKLTGLRGATLKRFIENILSGENLSPVMNSLPALPKNVRLSYILIGGSEDLDEVKSLGMDLAAILRKKPDGHESVSVSAWHHPTGQGKVNLPSRDTATAVELLEAMFSDMKKFMLLQVAILAPAVMLTPLLTLPLLKSATIVVLMLVAGNMTLGKLLPWKTAIMVGGGRHG